MALNGDMARRLLDPADSAKQAGDAAAANARLDPEVKLYRRRWYVLAIACLMGFAQGWIWNFYGPIAVAVERVLKWDDNTLALLANWGPFSYFLGFLPTTWLMDHKGARPALIAGAVLCFAAAAVKLAAPVDASRACLAWAHVGQMLNGLAGPVGMSVGPVLSAAWFPPHERTTATSFSAMFNILGNAVFMVVGPRVVPNTDPATGRDASAADVERNLRRYQWMATVYTAAVLVLVLAYLPSRPPTPPSASATVARQRIRDGVRALTTRRFRPFWVAACCYGVITGTYSGWGPVLTLILHRVAGASQDAAGLIGFWSTLGGCAVGIGISIVSDRPVRDSAQKHFFLLQQPNALHCTALPYA